MNKIIIISKLILCSFCLLLISCEAPEGATYPLDGSKVSFQAGRYDLSLAPEDGTVIKIAMNRSSSAGALDVPLVFKTTSPTLFSLNSSTISFKEGETVSYAEIKHATLDKLNPALTYSLVLKLDNMEQKSPSALDSVLVNVSRKITWKKIGTGTFTSAFFEKSWMQEIQQAQEDATVYCFPDCYTKNFPIMFSVAANNSISFSTQQTGYVDSQYGMTSFTMPTAASLNQPNKNGKVFNMTGRFVVSAGSFGEFKEVFTMN